MTFGGDPVAPVVATPASIATPAAAGAGGVSATPARRGRLATRRHRDGPLAARCRSGRRRLIAARCGRRRSAVTLAPTRAPSSAPVAAASRFDWPRHRRPISGEPLTSEHGRAWAKHAGLGLTLVRTRGYPRPSFAPAKQPRERGSGLAERGPPRRTPPGPPHRDPQPANGSTTSDSVQANWPSTSSSPATRTGPLGSPRASIDIELEHRHREFASATGRYRGQRVSVVSTGIGTDNVEIVVAEILAITERPTFIRVGSCGALQPEMAPRRPGHHHRRRPPRVDHELLRPRWLPGGRRLRGGRGAHRGRGAARTPVSRRDHGDGAGVLRCAGAPDPAVAHPLP